MTNPKPNDSPRSPQMSAEDKFLMYYDNIPGTGPLMLFHRNDDATISLATVQDVEKFAEQARAEGAAGMVEAACKAIDELKLYEDWSKDDFIRAIRALLPADAERAMGIRDEETRTERDGEWTETLTGGAPTLMQPDEVGEWLDKVLAERDRKVAELVVRWVMFQECGSDLTKQERADLEGYVETLKTHKTLAALLNDNA